MPSSTLSIGPQLEAWVLLVLAGSLQHQKVGVKIVPAGDFYVRLNQRKTFKGKNTSWIEVKQDDRDYELHNSLQVHGISGAHHEVDICLVSGSPLKAPVSWRKFRAGVECKQHTAAVSENVVRAIMGVNVDVCWFLPWRSCVWGLVSTNAAITKNTRLLLDSYKISHIELDAASLTHMHPEIDKLAKRIIGLL